MGELLFILGRRGTRKLRIKLLILGIVLLWIWWVLLTELTRPSYVVPKQTTIENRNNLFDGYTNPIYQVPLEAEKKVGI